MARIHAIHTTISYLSKYGWSNFVTILGVESIWFLLKVCARLGLLLRVVVGLVTSLALLVVDETEKLIEASMMAAAANVKLSENKQIDE